MQQFPQFLGRHHDLVRPAPAEQGDPVEFAGAQGVERMGDDIGPCKFRFGLGEDARHIESDIAHADDHRMAARKIGVERREFRMPVIPADEFGAAEDIAELRAIDRKGPVIGCAGSEHDRIVQFAQFGDRHVAADIHVADEAHIVARRHLLVAARDAFYRLVIGRHARADQPERDGQGVEHVDPHIVLPQLLRCFRRVISGRPRSDDGDVAHVCLSASQHGAVPHRWQAADSPGLRRDLTIK